MKFIQKQVIRGDLNFSNNVFEENPAIMLVLKDGDNFVGSVTYIPYFKRLIDVQILEDYRNRGLSHKLLRKAIKLFNPKELFIMEDSFYTDGEHFRPLKAKDLIRVYSKYGFKLSNKDPRFCYPKNLTTVGEDVFCYRMIR